MRPMAGRLAAPLVVACLWVAGGVVSAGAQASGPPIRIGGSLALTDPLGTTSIVHKNLALPIGIPNLSRYDGCHSWVRLESAFPTVDTRAVLDDHAFAHRLATVSEALADVRSVTT
jgi:hypothetical protein